MGPKILAPGIIQFDFPKKIASELVNEFKLIESEKWKASNYLIKDEELRDGVLRKSKNIQLHHIDKNLCDKVIKEIKINSGIYKGIYGIDFNYFEILDVLKYDVGDYFTKHIDTSPYKYRTVSLLIYLNVNEYTGGETKFHNFNLELSPSEPCMVFFPSNYPYSHSAMEIKSGTKYIIVGWFCDLPEGYSQNLISKSM